MQRKRVIAIAALLVASIAGATAASLAWFDQSTKIEPGTSLIGASQGAYFAYGDGGTGEGHEPFGIETPRQLYNLAWLQYLGFIDDVSSTNSDESYFELNADIDMTGWILPPIGTPDNPFMGHFDGRGYTISNLTVSDANFPTKPDTVSTFTVPHIYGLFGVVGPYYGSGKSYSSSTDAIANVIVSGITIKPTVTTALAGLVAGYVNGPISNVGVTDAVDANDDAVASKLDFSAGVTPYTGGHDISGTAFSKISQFGTVGYAEDTYVGHAKKTAVSMKGYTRATKDNLVVQDSGDNAGWGGSIDMETTYNGLLEVWDTYNTTDKYCPEFGSDSDGTGVYTYPANATETVTNGVSAGINYTNETVYTKNSYYNYYTTNAKNDQGKITAQYTFAHRSDSDNYMYLYGENDITVADATSKTTTTNVDISASLYTISATHGGTTYYLTYNNGSIGYTTSSAAATTWIYSDSHLFCQVNTNGSSSSYYYIYNNSGNLALTSANASGSAATITYESSTTGFYIAGSPNKYICYDDTGWVFASDGTVSTDHYQLSSGGYYVIVNNTGSGQTPSLGTPSTTAPSNKTYWHLDGNNLYVLIGQTKYYLCYDSGLTLSSTSSNKLTRNGNYFYLQYTTQSGKSTVTRYYCLQMSNGTLSATTNNTNYYSGSSFTLTNHTVTEDIDYDEAVSASAGTSYRDVDVSNSTEDYVIHTQSTYVPLRQEMDVTPTSTIVGYRFYYTTGGHDYYLTFDTSATNNVTAVEDASEATVWVTSGNYYCPLGQTTYYLSYNNGNVQCTTSTSNRFQLNNNALRVRINGNYYYVYYDGSSWVATTTNRTLTRETVYETEEKPNGQPMETNTGYIVGGASNDTEEGLCKGNLRVSLYAKSTYLSSIATIYTINGNGIKTTSANDWGEDSPYSTSLAKFTEVYNDASNIYGLHFMDSNMLYGDDGAGHDQSVYAEYAVINGEGYDNYELPQNCIDFNLKEKGYINFIAGTYFPGNNCFFTVSEIQRNASTQAITNIKNIRAVYSYASQPTYSNVFLYDDGTYSIPFKYVNGVKKTLEGGDYTPYSTQATLPTGYALEFNFNWIDTYQSGIIENATYYKKPFYFEIPMNAGEYCMGSPHFTDGTEAKGAYLMYLDIGANAAKMNRTSITEYIEEITKTFDYPLGLALVASGTASSSVNAFNSFCIVVDNRNTGAVTLSRTATATGVATNSDGSNAITLGFYDDGITVTNGSGGSLTEATVTAVTTITQRLTCYDYSTADGKLTKIIVNKQTIDGVAQTPTAEYYVYNANQEIWEVDNSLVLYDDSGARVTDLTNVVIDTLTTSTVLAFKNLYLSTGTITIVYGLEGEMEEDGSGRFFKVSGYDIAVTYTDTSGQVDLTDRLEIVSIVSTYNGLAITFVINSTTASSAGQVITVNLTTS